MTGVILPHIAFIGGMGTGKSTAAELLSEYYDYERLSFATPLKIMAGPNADRGFLQRFGTDVVRAACPDAWVNLLVHELGRHLAADSDPFGPSVLPVVVDDCRFPNEADRLREEGFLIVRLHAGIVDRESRLTANGKWGGYEALDHESETALRDYDPDWEVGNYGDLEDLLGELTAIINKERR